MLKHGLAAMLSLVALTTLAIGEQPPTVVAIAESYPDGGGYNQTWSGSGTPEAVMHDRQRVLAASEGGTYCCGYTFAVAMRVAADRGLLNGKSFDEVKRFQKLWYGATELDDETLVVLAVETLGIGRGVPLDQAKPGDFVQLWRRNSKGERGSGHSVIFLGWVEESGRRVGFRYRSSQGSTDGIGDNTEYFAELPGRSGRVMRDRTYACRLYKNPAEAASKTTQAPGSGTAVEKTSNESP